MILAGWLKAAALLPSMMATPLLDDGQAEQQPAQARARYTRALRAYQLAKPGQGEAFRYHVAPEQLQTLTDFVEPPVLGLTLRPVPAVLLAQLDLEKGQAQLVAEVAEGSPAAEAGVQKHDLLLAVGDAKATDAKAIADLLAEDDGETVKLALLRKGKKLEVEVALAKKAEAGTERKYYIGFSVGTLDESTREQLGLGDDQGGLVVLDVVDDSPAAEAELKANDILLQLDGKPISETEQLVGLVQELGDQKIELKFLREGDEKAVEVTPRVRPAEATAHFNVQGVPFTGQQQFQLYGPGVVVGPNGAAENMQRRFNVVPGVPGAQGQPPVMYWRGAMQDDLAQKLEDLSKELKELREQVESLKKQGDR